MSTIKVKEVQEWIEIDKDSINESDKNLESGFYKREEVSIESHYYGQCLI